MNARDYDVVIVGSGAGGGTVAKALSPLVRDGLRILVLEQGAKIRDEEFTGRELDLMAVLWELGSATVSNVRERLADQLAYTTVLTILRTLEAKGYVGHTGEGRAYRYRPLVKREAAGKTALRHLLDKMFRGSPELLLTQLVSDRGLNKEELRSIRRMLAERLREEH